MGWGATRYAIREAVDILNAAGVKANALHFIDIYPLDQVRLEKELSKAQYLIDVEGNYTAQLAQVVRTYTGRAVDDKVLKYDGRPFTGAEIANAVKSRLKHATLRLVKPRADLKAKSNRRNGHGARKQVAKKVVRRKVKA
jgi:2-oxoglutarate ferredoxin oxidoreductase subunit alpha